MNRIYLFLILVFFSSCSKNYLFNRDQILISKKMDDIKDTDQGVRNFSMLMQNRYHLRTLYSVHDSLSLAGIKIEEAVKYDFLKIPSIEKQIQKLSPNLQEEYASFNRRQDKIIHTIDSLNADCIYKMIKKYGYPSFDNRKWTKTPKNGFAFVMTHINYKSETGKKILSKMIAEYLNGRVNEGEMQQYLWHINGRKGGYPYNYVINIEEWKRKIKDL